MKYFIIKPEVKEEYIYIRPEDIDLPEEFSMLSMEGHRIEQEFIIKLRNRKRNVYFSDFIAGPVTVPIISNKFKELLKSINDDNIQFFKANIYDEDNMLINDQFFHMHLINNLDSFDIDKSKFTIMYEQNGKVVDGITFSKQDHLDCDWFLDKTKNIILKDEVVLDRFIFRENLIGSLIIINEDLKNKIEEAGLIGIDIQPLETYSY